MAEELAQRAALSIQNARLFAEAQRAIQTREEVLAIVSHDLKNPLSTIQLLADMLRGFEMIDRGIPRQHYEIQDASGNRIGEVTSGTQSPTLGKAIGIGYVTPSLAKEGTDIFIVIRDKKLKASVVKMPFLKK